jgi:hypothetical protein
MNPDRENDLVCIRPAKIADEPHLILSLTREQVNDLFCFCAKPPDGWDPGDNIQDEVNIQWVMERAEGGVLASPGTFSGYPVFDFALWETEIDTLLRMERSGSDLFFSSLIKESHG